MKNKKTMKMRIAAGMLSLVTVFSVGACSVTTASAATPSVMSVAKDISNFALVQTIDKFVTNGIAGSLLKMGTGYLLNWVFDSTCNISDLDKHFTTMRDFVLGKRLSTDRGSGYEVTTNYLYNKVTEKYKETAHN